MDVKLSDAVRAVVAPPLCAACGRGCGLEEPLCTYCAARLHRALPLSGRGAAGVDRTWSSASHQGVARELITALKFRRLLCVATLMAGRIHCLAPAELLTGTIVPVPTSRTRYLSRGFDPTHELAVALSDRATLPLRPCLARHGAGRQVGRRRAERVGRPPGIVVIDEVPRSVVLLDDVLTTGATLSACAAALRRAGSVRVVAITFARRL